MNEKLALSFKPGEVIRRLLSGLPKRSQDVLVSRYGLGSKAAKLTLDAIGKKYNITRERVRQIESHSLLAIRKSKAYKEAEGIFTELKEVILNMGGLVSESDLLKHLSKSSATQHLFHFLLVIGEEFKHEKEDKEFKHRWHVDEALSERIKAALRKLYAKLSDDELMFESDFINSFLEELKDLNEKYKNEEVIKRWLTLSRQIGRNQLGEWGRSSSSNVNAKGMRDFAFLVVRKHGSPIHFKEVAKAIARYFNKKAHVATTHNELIKDPRFVLVGRGLYALSEWGYMSGVVKEVIRKILEKEGPLPKEKIVEKVLKERYVKENTIMVNLQNSKYFKRDRDNCYRNV